jgi:Flp pilus assembly protein TadD
VLRRLITKSLLFIGILFLCSCTTTVNSNKSYFDKSKQTRVDEKQEEPQSKIAQLPYPELIGKGRDYLKNGNTQLARLHFTFALKKKPESAEALVGLGTIYHMDNQIAQSRELFHLALEKEPNNTRAMLFLGKIAREEGDLTSSLQWLNKANERKPEDAEILTELAITNDTIGQEHLVYAEPLYRKIIELRPQLAAARNNLGFNLLLQGRYLEAIETFSKALALDPRNSRTKNNLATAYLLNNEKEKALTLYEGAVGKAAAYNNLGYINMTQGNWEQAEKAFKKALATNPVFYSKAQQNLERLKNLRSEATLQPLQP